MIDNLQQERFLILFKQDIESLYDRLIKRQKEYVSILVGKRVRDHFDLIFKSKYDSATLEMLVQLPREVIESIGAFYKETEDLRWYFYHTEDMAATIQDILRQRLNHMGKLKDRALESIDQALFHIGQDAFLPEVNSELEVLDTPPLPPPSDID